MFPMENPNLTYKLFSTESFNLLFDYFIVGIQTEQLHFIITNSGHNTTISLVPSVHMQINYLLVTTGDMFN